MNIDKIISIVKTLREEAAMAGDDPPVKKRKKYIYGGRGSRRMWLANKK